MTNYTMHNRTYRYHPGPHTYPFGYGLSYTNFSYTGLSLTPPPSSSPLPPCATIRLNLTLTNTGAVGGAEVVQLYLSLPNATTPNPPLRTLVGVRKVHLSPGESQTLTFTLPPRARAVMREGDFVEVLQPGVLSAWVGGGQPPEGCPPEKLAPGLALPSIEIAGPTTPLSQCTSESRGGEERRPRAPILKLTSRGL